MCTQNTDKYFPYTANEVGKSLLAGGLAGMFAKTTVAPLDRIKILFQAQNPYYKDIGMYGTFKKIIREENFLALYKGNGAQMMRIFPYASTQFTSFEIYKKAFSKALNKNTSSVSGIAGAFAGVTSICVTYPLDTIRARLAFQVAGNQLYNGIADTLVKVYSTEGGIKAFYKGFCPSVCGMIPYAGISFYCFEKMKYICIKYFPQYMSKHDEKMSGGVMLTIPARLLSGGMAGAFAQSVSYPFDVTRRRMQLAGMAEDTKKYGIGMITTIKLVYKENGIKRGLYRGMSINYLRAVPMTAVSFSVYELTKQMLGLDVGLKIKSG